MRFSCLFQHISPFKYERIDKILTERGIKSRNEATKLLQSGKVKVNGIIIRGRGERFPSNIEINIENKLLPCIPLLVLYHKPINVLSSMGDPWGRQNLSELSKKYSYLNDMHPVGRLDYDTSGLLLFSKDGNVTNFLLDPKIAIEREYEAIVTGEVIFDQLFEKLNNGVTTQLGTFSANLLQSQVINSNISFNSNIVNFQELSDKLRQSYVRLSVKEGKYRMVRRILHNSGHSVLKLKRIRYGEFLLNNLSEGDCREINNSELEWFLSVYNWKTSKLK